MRIGSFRATGFSLFGWMTGKSDVTRLGKVCKQCGNLPVNDHKRVSNYQYGPTLSLSRISPEFEPYVLRHTSLTRIAPHCYAFTLARIAGHSSITITQRYCHPQADAVEAAFAKFGHRTEVVTEGGHQEKALPPAPDEVVVLSSSAA